MPRVLCCICQEVYGIENITVRLCGHGYCVPCNSATRACAICREPNPHNKGIRLYLTFLDELSPEESVRNVVDKLNAVEISAMRDLEARLFAELESSESECQLLRERIKRLERVDKVADDLEVKLQEARKGKREARAFVHALQDELEASKKTNIRLSRRVDKEKREADEAKGECQRLHDVVAKKDREISLLKNKLKAMAKDKRRPRHDPDDSLVVEPPRKRLRQRSIEGD